MKVGTAEMAKILSLSRTQVCVLAKEGKLKANKDRWGHWQFDLNDYKVEREVTKEIKLDKRLLLARMIKKIGVNREVVDQAIADGDLEVKVIGGCTYIANEVELYYLSCVWKRRGWAKSKWTYAGIPPHLKGKFVDFVVNVIEETDAKKRLSLHTTREKVKNEKASNISITHSTAKSC